MTPSSREHQQPAPHLQPHHVPLPLVIAAAWAWRVLIVVVALAALVAVLREISLVVVPLAVASLLTVLLTPLCIFHPCPPASLKWGAAALVAILGFLSGPSSACSAWPAPRSPPG